jgi:hypothetical protein
MRGLIVKRLGVGRASAVVLMTDGNSHACTRATIYNWFQFFARRKKTLDHSLGLSVYLNING